MLCSSDGSNCLCAYTNRNNYRRMRTIVNVLGVVALLSLFTGLALYNYNQTAGIALMCEGLILFIMFTVMDDKIDEQKKADVMRRNTYRY